ncbi:peptide-methionine (S)-S-oxide reductase MsrA [Sphingomicrobium astaxanthinifaciens]|uniref:peptide-methionine (S)-S-oxide reductase MsrA n=1 Tax=Sphingomicrobium astaxanthinifaciens TaxID=1227949 RepID=UPI001FCB6F9F|nr:peptide-methionine (S)-S-oxide reductase MsrA [Sphingomicrobium astaxanthinifaciens]MCJ7422407.1 peptide-methionine (S)-S-oxide reductase MsrA [Sphingomicrobium astaxanthinifaciens]
MPRAALAVAVLLLLAGCGEAVASGGDEKVPAAWLVIPHEAARETAYFAGGCFWGVEAVFEQVAGVAAAVSGYAGGRSDRVTYKEVTAGGTGHAETVRVVFDPAVVSYTDLLRVYFSVIADPTLRNRQGPDFGAHYRTALFPVDARQARQARAYLAQLERAGVYDRPIVTTLERARPFVVAEPYHQDFARRHPRHPYIVRHDAPKVAAFKRLFPELAR